MNEFPPLTGATIHLIPLMGPAQNPECLLQLHEHKGMPFYKFLGGYVDILLRESLEDAIRREIDEEAMGLAKLLDLSDERLNDAAWFAVMNYRKERKETCTFIVAWLRSTECVPVKEYVQNRNDATLLAVSGGETSGLAIKPILEVLEETFSTGASRRKLIFPCGLLDKLLAGLPPLDPSRITAIQQAMMDREATRSA